MFQLIRDSEVRFPQKPETSPEAKDLILKVFIEMNFITDFGILFLFLFMKAFDQRSKKKIWN